MKRRQELLIRLFRELGSSRLAIQLIVLVILFALAGALFPQVGYNSTDEISGWMMRNPLVSAIAQPLTLFNVFHSFPFLVTIVLLALNNLICTINHIGERGSWKGFLKISPVRNSGYLLLHLSLLGLLVGGFISLAFKLDGTIVLTEGQSFRERHDGYLKIVEGPFRPEIHYGFTLTQRKIERIFEQDRYPVKTSTEVDITGDSGSPIRSIIKINYPIAYRDLRIRLVEVGYSPRLEITRISDGAVVVNAFTALQTNRIGDGWSYRDYLALPFLPQRVFLTLLPDYTKKGTEYIKKGEIPRNPIILIERELANKKLESIGPIRLGEEITLDQHRLKFAELRRWNSLQIVADPGYPLVVVSFWIGVVGIFLRYFPLFKRWFRQEEESDDDL